jgi:carbonic anhydrase/acetyltransferase-like protein (isoleucine patch superfamily)
VRLSERDPLPAALEDWWHDFHRSLRRRGRSDTTAAMYRRSFERFWRWALGLVMDSATVAESAFVGAGCLVRDRAQILDRAQVRDRVHVRDEAVIEGDAVVAEDASVIGRAQVGGHAVLTGHSRLRGDVVVEGDCVVSGATTVVSRGRFDSGVVTTSTPSPQRTRRKMTDEEMAVWLAELEEHWRELAARRRARQQARRDAWGRHLAELEQVWAAARAGRETAVPPSRTRIFKRRTS